MRDRRKTFRLHLYLYFSLSISNYLYLSLFFINLPTYISHISIICLSISLLISWSTTFFIPFSVSPHLYILIYLCIYLAYPSLPFSLCINASLSFFLSFFLILVRNFYLFFFSLYHYFKYVSISLSFSLHFLSRHLYLSRSLNCTVDYLTISI